MSLSDFPMTQALGNLCSISYFSAGSHADTFALTPGKHKDPE